MFWRRFWASFAFMAVVGAAGSMAGLVYKQIVQCEICFSAGNMSNALYYGAVAFLYALVAAGLVVAAVRLSRRT